MLVSHATKQRWIKSISPSIFPEFGKNNSKKIQTLLTTLKTSSITHSFELLSTDHIEWFEQKYNTILATKHNPRPFDVYATTLGKEKILFPYYILTVFENEIPIGGTIFVLRTDRLSMVYRTYPPDWTHNNFKCSPALYAEFLATEYALAQNKPRLAHGIDFNPYGVHSHVGVAIFKLSIGCHAEIQSMSDVTETDLNTLPYNSLLLTKPTHGNRITEAFLIGDSETTVKYEQLFKYPDQLLVTLYTPAV